MSSNNKKINLSFLIDKYKKGLLIPEIQRDYVMGAGGKGKNGKDKLENLLENINHCAENNLDFDFSCIISYQKNKNSRLEIYDGQQRLTTLLFLYLYKLQVEDIYDKEKLVNENWLEFSGRPISNDIFSVLANGKLAIDKIEVCDFTSFCIKNLLNEIDQNKYKFITSDYLLNRVRFDMVSIGSQNEIEQFFMDLNSGLQLKDYEIYKAKLNHRVMQIREEWEKYGSSHIYEESITNWSYKLDNEWLNFFEPFSSFEHSEEEYEIAFIQYCFCMTRLEQNFISKDYKVDDVDMITIDSVKRVYDILCNVTKLNFKFKEEFYNCSSVLQFSWGDMVEQTDGVGREKYNYDKRGAYWSLADTNYESMLYHVIKDVILCNEKYIELYDDVVLWCFITTLDWLIDYQNTYLRIIKKLLNHNVYNNLDAWYECTANGRYIYYCKNIVYGIPQYYGKHFKIQKDDELQKMIGDIMFLNVKLSNPKNHIEYDRSIIELNNRIVKMMLNGDSVQHSTIVDVLKLHSKFIEIDAKNQYELCGLADMLLLANNTNIDELSETDIENLLDEKKNTKYCSKVNLSWPIRRSSSTMENVYILSNVKYDKIFGNIKQNDLAEKVLTTNFVYSNNKTPVDIKECFWDKQWLYRLKANDGRKTYNKKDSESEEGWTLYWDLTN